MMTTTEKARPAALQFGFGNAAIGLVLAARSDQGVASILIGSHHRKLRRDLAAAFPEAKLAEDQSALAETLMTIIEVIDDPRKTLDLPLDIRGSQTQLAVWEALRAIPAGETRSYGQIAKALTVPSTAKDVGAACAANVLAVAIPCHRVLRADGSISGYRWGVARKRLLLQAEATV